jgi:phosphoribosylformimino-5-aminoimidazole carboxamide ribotide isomerase
MIVFPAIDIRDGNCVRLVRGDFTQETVFSSHPEDMAIQWQKQGAGFLHLVDLDGAREGRPVNLDTVEKILAAIQIPVELGGGIRTMKDIEKVLSAGVKRVILGSVAVRDPLLVKDACAAYGDCIVVGIDANNGIVAVDGWGTSGDIDIFTLAERMKDAGVNHVIYTDISRDGTLSGVNVDATAALAKKSGLKVVASGGVHSLEDIKALKAHESDGIEGVIVGKSIYTGSLDLPQAIEIASKEG